MESISEPAEVASSAASFARTLRRAKRRHGAVLAKWSVGLALVSAIAVWGTVYAAERQPTRANRAPKHPREDLVVQRRDTLVGGIAPVAPPQWEHRVLSVFFSDAFSALGPGQPPTALATASSSSGSAGTPASKPPEGASSAPGTQWSAWIRGETLEDEVKRQVPVVAAAVRSPSVFRSKGARDVRREFSLLAVVFGVIAEYDGQVRWKKPAAGLRDLLARAARNAKTTSDAAFKESKQRVAELTDLVRGATIDVPEGAVPASWPSVSDRRPLMLRMEAAQRGRLDAWTANEKEFQRNKDAIAHEAEMLAMLAEVILAEGYEYADDDGYRQYAGDLKQRCREILEAIELDRFKQAQSAVRNVNKSCDDCHTDYRG